MPGGAGDRHPDTSATSELPPRALSISSSPAASHRGGHCRSIAAASRQVASMCIDRAGAPRGSGWGVQAPSVRAEAHKNDLHLGSSCSRAARWHNQARAGALTSLAHRSRRRSEQTRPGSFLPALHSGQPPGRSDRDASRSDTLGSVLTARCMSPGAASGLLQVTCISVVPVSAQVPNAAPMFRWHACAMLNVHLFSTGPTVRRRASTAHPRRIAVVSGTGPS